MKNSLWSVLAFLSFSLSASAQVARVARPAEAPKVSEPRVVERGPHHRVWERTITDKLPDGRTIERKSSFTELANGLHHLKDGQWVESREEIEVFPGGAIARSTAHQVIWSPNINSAGAIDLLTPDGKRFRSHIIGLAYMDAATGKSEMIAEIKDSVGELVGSNQVIYRDAFTDFRADVRYTLTRAGFEQDIILRENPPSPMEYGMNPATTRLEVWTEFIEAPEPVRGTSLLKQEEDMAVRRGMVDPDLTDERLEFGEMTMGPGRAFPTENESDEFSESSSTPVGKNWIRIQGRQFLIEKVDYRDVLPQLDRLPKSAAVTPVQRNQMQAARRGENRSSLLAAAKTPAPALPATTNPMRLAQVAAKERGFVLDYTLSGSLTNFTFRGGTTYYISGNVTLSGTTVIEGGVIVKYTNTIVAIQGPVDCRTDVYRPSFFMSKNDNTYGEIIPGSTGNPLTNYYGSRCLDFTGNTNAIDLHNLRFRHSFYAVYLNTGCDVTVRHSQFYRCFAGIVSYGGSKAKLRNALIHDGDYAIGGTSLTNIQGEHLTAHRLKYLISSSSAYLTNSIVLAVTNSVKYTGANVLSNSVDTGYFQTLAGGARYLVNASTNRNAGTTNINAGLLADLKRMTTEPPKTLYDYFYANTNLSPVIVGDTVSGDLPDLGYHYSIIDYLASGAVIDTGVTVVATNGVNIAIDYSQNNFGFALVESAFISQGNPFATNRIFRAHMVQETSTGNPGTRMMFYDAEGGFSQTAQARLRFTELIQLPSDGYILFTGTGFSALELSHSSIYGPSFVVDISGSSPLVCGATNSFWEGGGVQFGVGNYGTNTTVHLRNNLFRYTGIAFVGGTNTWTVCDNLFDSVSTNIYDFGSPVQNSFNAYYQSTNVNFSGGTNNLFLSSLAYETGPLSRYYLPTNSPLINAGSTSASSVGLYHFTTTTNQVKEGSSTDDIGLHFVALNGSNQTVDSDSDGIADYVEDLNGNGITDGNENSGSNPVLTVVGNMTYIKGGPGKRFDTNAVAYDADSANFSGGRLTVTITSGAEAGDVLGVRNRGTDAGQISVSGTNVSYSGVIIGTNSGGTGTNPLVIQFNANAVNSAVQALVSNLTFQNLSNNPAISNRVVKFELTDGKGGTNSLTTQTISIVCPDSMDLMLVVDRSNSMIRNYATNCPNENNFTTDTNRFWIAKAAASNFVDSLDLAGNDRVGLISFAGAATLNVPLTNNAFVVQSNIYALVNTSGTELDDPINLARTNLSNSASNVLRVMVILSDGEIFNGTEQTNPSVAVELEAARLAADADIRIITVAFYTGECPRAGGTNFLADISGSPLDYYFIDPGSLDYHYAPTFPDLGSNFTSVAQSLCRIVFPPTVSITTPTNNTLCLITPTNIAISATAGDSDGTVTKVEFFHSGTVKIGEDTGPPYSVIWTNPALGDYLLSAIATDNSGLMATSSVVAVFIRQVPAVSIITPTNNQTFLAPAQVSLTALAGDADGVITNVSYFSSGVLIGRSTISPYRFAWTNVMSGNYTLTAVATDNHGLTNGSATVSVVVNKQPPKVKLLAPLDGTTNAVSEPVVLEAQASDADGTVASVVFYDGTTPIWTNTTPPYRVTYGGLGAGLHNFKARATDNDNLSTDSSTAVVWLVNCTPASLDYLVLNASTVAAGDSLTAAIYLNGPAMAGGQTILVTSENPFVVPPPTVLVPEGYWEASFSVETRVTTNQGPAGLAASYHAQTVTNQFSVLGMSRTLPFSGPMDVAFVIDTTTSMWLGVGDLKNGITNILDRIEAASGGDYQLSLVIFDSTSGCPNCPPGKLMDLKFCGGDIDHDYVCVLHKFAPGNRQSVDDSIVGFVQGNELGSTEASDQALNTVVHGLSQAIDLDGNDYDETERWQASTFEPEFGREATKVIVLVTDSLPGGFYNGTYDADRRAFALDKATNAASQGIKICAVQVGSDTNVAALMTEYAQITGGAYAQSPADGSGVGKAIARFFMPYGDSSGDEVVVRHDEQSSHVEMAMMAASGQATNILTSSFDLRGLFGEVSDARLSRSGTLRFDRGQSFDLELGAGVTGGTTNSFAYYAADAQTFGTNTNYVVNWTIGGSVRSDIENRLGDRMLMPLVNRWSSVCGGGLLATDTPQEHWPLARNEITLLNTTSRLLPQGRCRDLVLASTNSPLNGWWDVTLYGNVVASSGLSVGWDVEEDHTVFGGFIVTVPTNAVVSAGYELRVLPPGSNAGRSGRFEVVSSGFLDRAAVLRPLALSTNVVASSVQVSLFISLDAPAPVGGATVTLKTSGLANPGLPGYVVIPSGATSITTNFTQGAGSLGQLTITATYNGYREARLRVVNCSGSSIQTPQNPSSLTNGNVITLTWDAVSSASSYLIERRIGSSGSWSTFFSGLVTNRFVDPEAVPPATYEYQIYAVNDCLKSSAAWVQRQLLFSHLPPAPSVKPTQGPYHNNVAVRVTNNLDGSRIYYTLDNTLPTTSSDYVPNGETFIFSSTTTLRAFTTHTNFSQRSRDVFAHYVIQEPAQVDCGLTNVSRIARTNAPSTVFGPGFYSSRFWFMGTSNQVMDLKVASTNFDTFLLLMDGATNLVAFNDDAEAGVTDSRVFTQIPSNGVYYVEVTSYYREDSGWFELTTDCVGFPEIRILNTGGTNLPIGRLIEMGTTNAGAGLLSRTLTISNAGTAALTLSNYVISPTNFHVAQPSPSELAPGATQTVTVKLTNNVVGEFYGQLDIYSNDSELEDGIENPFVIFFHGRVDPAPAPPTVSILFPTNGMVIPDAPVNTEIVATAADADGIKQVELYVGTTLLSTVKTHPYRTNWNNVTAGQYTLTARAYDSNNIATTSSPVVVTIGRPTITLAQTAPCVGMIGTSQRTITATVKDATGAAVQSVPVTFTVTGPNAFTTNRTTIANGTASFTYTGTVPGYDHVVASATVSSINITSSETNLSWAGVTNCTPMNGALTIDDGPSIGCQCSTFARYADFYRFTANSGQTLTFRMRSFDFEPLFFILNANGCQVLATNFVLNSSNALRSFTVPTTGDYFVEVTTIGLYETGAYTLEVECSTPGATSDLAVFVSGVPVENGFKVDFGSTTVGTPTSKSLVLSNAGGLTLYLTNLILPGDFGLSSPFPATLNPGGSTNFTLYLTNSLAGERGEPLTINSGDPDEQPFVLNLSAIVNPAGSPPSVTLTQPAGNTVFSVPATVALSANATANGGAVITNVVFIYITSEGNFVIAHDTNAPYTAVWSTDVPGAYTLAAAAYDSVGRLTISAPVSVVVQPLSMNRPPAATNDALAVAANSLNNTLDVLANDRDPDLDALSIVDINLADTKGTVTIIDAGKAVRYTPPRGIKGNPADGFYYVVTDGKGGFATAKVEVAVEASDVPAIVLTNIPSSFCVGMVTNIQASVSPWQNVTNVEFYLGKVKLGATNAGVNGVFTLPWSVFTDYCQCGLTAAAYDRFGQKGVTTSAVEIDVERCDPNAQPPVARLDNLAPTVRTENQYSFFTTPTIRQGLFTLQGAAYHATNGVPVSYAVLLLSTTGELLRDLTPSPGTDGFHAGAAGGISTTGVLASCDFTTLENGVYDLLLEVRGGGDQTNAIVRFILESDLKLGPFGFTEQDLIIPVSGLPLTVLRTYNSLNPRNGDFGYSWTYSLLDLQIALDEERTDVFALGDEGPGPGGSFSLRTGGGRNMMLTLPDGRRTTFYFDFTPVPGSQKLSLAPIWHSVPGVNAKLEVLGLHQFEPLVNGGIWQGDGNSAYEWYEFPGWTLTTEDGTQFIIEREVTGDFELLGEENEEGGFENTENGTFNAKTYSPPRLSRIVQRSGDEIRIQRERTDTDQRRRFNIDHVSAAGSTNLSVVLERDGQGRIIAISDPLGQNGSGQPTGPAAVKYEYDAVGNLSKVLRLVDRAANGGAGSYLTNRYFYEHSRFPHYLTRIEDARGIAVARNLYDDSGKLIGVIDAAGRTNRFDHDMDGRREVIYDRLGRQTEHFYDERGNVTRTINALGESVARQYDANNYLTEEVNALGETNRYTYDGKGNRTAMTNALGHVSLLAFSETSRLLTALDPLGHGVTNNYDSRDNLAETVNALGETNRFLYDDRSLLVSQVNALGQVVSNRYNANGWVTNTAAFTNFSGGLVSSTAFAYDANGNRTNETLVRKTNGVPAGTNVTTSIYDSLNRLVLSIDTLGRTNRTVYDAAGRVESTFDALNRETRHRYDARGLLTNITYPDLTFDVYTYDAEGRRTNSMDRLGRSTSFVYDLLGRLVSTIYSDGAMQSTAFDQAGRVAYTVDARGVTNAFGYDAAGRRVAVTNALGTPQQQVMRYEFDAAGNMITMADGTGRFVEHEYDALNRRLRTLYPPSAPGLPRPFTATAYDSAGRRVFETNEAGVVTHFTYDALGRMTTVTNAMGLPEKAGVSYVYDEAGNLTVENRPIRATRFEYDGLGRRTRRTIPGGVITESFGYDLAGNMVAHTNFNGLVITNAYDVMNRLLGVWHGSTQLVAYAYTTNGLRASASNEAGVVSWVYDSRDRVRTNATPTGTLLYDYDVGGSLTNLASTTLDGVRTAYALDALSRLTNVTDASIAAPNQSAYRFDAAGNLLQLDQPNGVTHQWRHDARHRLTNLVVSTLFGVGTVLGQFDYALASTGQRTQLVEQVSTAARTHFWQHDALHRLTNNTILGTGPTGMVAYVYDVAHNRTTRSSTSALNGILTNQSLKFDYKDRLDNDAIASNTNPWYDNNGNPTNYQGAPFQYDWANRLTNAVVGGNTISLAYDADGNRVRKTVGSATTLYLISTISPSGYAQVVEELSVSGGTTNLAKVYTYGLDLISQRDASTVLYLAVDGLGSTRLLTDTSASVANAFTYDAYGTLIASNDVPQTDFLFAGEQWDPHLRLYNNRARLLDPGVGRFLNRDTYEGSRSDPLSLHKYLYAHANPVNGVDPAGHEFTILGVNVSTAIQKTLRVMGTGAAFGAAFGAGDAYFGERDIVEGAIEGAVVGAFLGPLGRVNALRPLLFTAGIGLGATGAYDAYMDGDSGLALYRGITMVAGLRGMIRTTTKTGNVSLYRSVNPKTGEMQYIGITDDLSARAAAHLRMKGISIQPVEGLRNLSRADARAVEQVLIEYYGLGKNGGTLLNKINSISSKNPRYGDALKRGAALLSKSGYEGFQQLIPITWAEIVLGDEDSILADHSDTIEP